MRKAEKDEEKQAREKIMQKVNADKVNLSFFFFFVTFTFKTTDLYCVLKAERKSRLGLQTEAGSTSTSTLVAPLDADVHIASFILQCLLSVTFKL